MPDKTYRMVLDNDGGPRALIRGAGERYNGAGGWVVDGSVIRYYGLGGDSYDLVEVSDDELPGIMAIIDARFAALAPTTDAEIERALVHVEAAPVSPTGMPSPDEGLAPPR